MERNDMTEQQDEDEPDSDIPTAADAKREWTEHIARLREGDKGQRRLAELLSECRKGERCHLEECPKCERRKEIARLRIPADAVKSIGSRHPITNIRVGAIVVDGKRRPLDKKKCVPLRPRWRWSDCRRLLPCANGKRRSPSLRVGTASPPRSSLGGRQFLPSHSQVTRSRRVSGKSLKTSIEPS